MKKGRNIRPFFFCLARDAAYFPIGGRPLT
jgi:hypothetical protein